MYYASIFCTDKNGIPACFTRGKDHLQNSPSFDDLIELLQWGKERGIKIQLPPHNIELSPTMRGKQNIALSKKLRFAFGIYSWRDAIDGGNFTARQVSVENAVKYNRRKYNRMGWDEQKEYVKSLLKKKTVYSLVNPNGHFVDCPKLVWEYAQKLPIIEMNFYREWLWDKTPMEVTPFPDGIFEKKKQLRKK